jgi:hypothetical protein
MVFGNAFARQPVAYFEIGNHGSAGLGRKRHTIGNMIAVAMRNQNVIGLYAGNINMFRKCVRRNKRIYQKALAAQLQCKTRMSVKSEPHKGLFSKVLQKYVIKGQKAECGKIAPVWRPRRSGFFIFYFFVALALLAILAGNICKEFLLIVR